MCKKMRSCYKTFFSSCSSDSKVYTVWLCCPLIFPASGQITISWTTRMVWACNHKPIYILMSMTLDGSVGWATLSDTKQLRRGKFWVLLKEGENQLTMICGNWQGILLECVQHSPFSHTVWLQSKKQQKNIIMFITFSTVQSEPNWSRLDGLQSLTRYDTR